MTDEEVLAQLSKLWGTLNDHPTELEVETVKEKTKAALVSYQQYGKTGDPS